MFSVGSKLYETNQNGQLRTVLENDIYEITSFDYNFVTNTFYFADEKSNKVIQIILFNI